MKLVSEWTCPSGHVIGQVVRNGHGIRQLLVYRQAVDRSAEQLEQVEVMAVAEGLLFDVKCSICGGFRTWVPGKEALKRLLKSAIDKGIVSV